MQAFHFTGDTDELLDGLALLAEDGMLMLRENGFPVSVSKGNILEVYIDSEQASVVYPEKAAFFRGVSLLLQHMGKIGTRLRESSCFDKNGIMLDCSRNAVLKEDTIRYMLRKMALMGLNLCMMYTEDTYEIPGEPYFGYLRGRFSAEELSALDDYAFALGIEMIPCIQTLSHLERALQWPSYDAVSATPSTLLVGEEETYAFIEKMIVAASAPYRSRRIHIGMDEAHDLNEGKYRQRHGEVPRHDIIEEHLRRVTQLLRKHGLEPMMWSDMHFRPSFGGYYSDTKALPQEVVDSAPEDVGLVYWDYYNDTPEYYEAMILQHQRFRAKTLFAGGIWTWTGPAPDYDKTLRTTVPALQACKKLGIREVFATAWGDNGAETSLLSILYGLQMFAEIGYHGEYREQEVLERFRCCVGEDGEAFLGLADFQHFPGEKADCSNWSKILLYSDPLLPLFENDTQGLSFSAQYEGLMKRYAAYKTNDPHMSRLFAYYAALGKALWRKCQWLEQAPAVVRSGDRSGAKALAKLAVQTADVMQELRKAWATLWYAENKPFGFEVIDIRMGAQIARCETAAERMRQFADGTLDTIPELTAQKLPFTRDKDGVAWTMNNWLRIVSPSAM